MLPAALLPCSDKRTQGDCDVPEYCTGYDADCPPNKYQYEGTVCRAAYVSALVLQPCAPLRQCRLPSHTELPAFSHTTCPA
jgi:hypothetical protein